MFPNARLSLSPLDLRPHRSSEIPPTSLLIVFSNFRGALSPFAGHCSPRNYFRFAQQLPGRSSLRQPPLARVAGRNCVRGLRGPTCRAAMTWPPYGYCRSARMASGLASGAAAWQLDKF